jgi:hypothetical protein
MCSGSFGNFGLNIALNVTPPNAPATSSTVTAGGTGGAGNIALNLFGRGTAGDPNSMRVVANGYFDIATNVGGHDNIVESGSAGTGSVINLATNLFGSNSVVTAQGGIWNWATNLLGDNNTVVTAGSLVNTASNLFGSNNTVMTTGGYANWGRNIFGNGNTVMATGGYQNVV